MKENIRVTILLDHPDYFHGLRQLLRARLTGSKELIFPLIFRQIYKKLLFCWAG